MDNFELIIFDCSGVLVDSERIANEVFAKILNEECGLSFSLNEMFEIFVGRSSAQCMAIVEKMTGSQPPPNLETRYKTEIEEALRCSVCAVDGIEQALREISIPYCVASSGSHEKMATTLGKANLFKLFEGKLHSTSDVVRGKPFPDVYLHAAQQMGCIDSAKCLVIEDSPLGVEGGVAAGMVVFGYAQFTSEHKLIQAGAHNTFTDMRTLPGEIAAHKERNGRKHNHENRRTIPFN